MPWLRSIHVREKITTQDGWTFRIGLMLKRRRGGIVSEVREYIQVLSGRYDVKATQQRHNHLKLQQQPDQKETGER